MTRLVREAGVLEVERKPHVRRSRSGSSDGERRRHDADDRVRRIAKREHLAEHGFARTESLAPEPFAEQHDVPAPRVALREHPPANRTHAREFGERRQDRRRHDAARLARRRLEIHAPRELRLHRLERVRRRAPLADHRRRRDDAHGHARVVAARRLLFDVDDAIGVPIGKRMEQQRAHDAEHRGRRADSQRQRRDRDGRPRLLAAERAQREGEILPRVGDELRALHLGLPMMCRVEQHGARFRQRSESADRLLVRLVVGHARRRELLGAQREVELDLVLDLALPPVPPAQREVERPSNAGPDHRAGAPSSAATVRIVVTVSAYFIQLLVSVRRCVRPAGVIL